MAAAAVRRNRAAVEAGRVRVVAAALVDADLGEEGFDMVVAVDVRASWTPRPPSGTSSRGCSPRGGRVVLGSSVVRAGEAGEVPDRVARTAGAGPSVTAAAQVTTVGVPDGHDRVAASRIRVGDREPVNRRNLR